jgi:hypothetical protein
MYSKVKRAAPNPTHNFKFLPATRTVYIKKATIYPKAALNPKKINIQLNRIKYQFIHFCTCTSASHSFLCCLNKNYKRKFTCMLLTSVLKKNISSALLVTAFVAVLCSCKKDKEDGPGNNPPVTERIKQYTQGNEFVKFDYNASGDVTTVTINSEVNTGGVPTAYSVSYDGAKKITSLQNTDGEKIVPVYENNRIIRADMLIADERIGYTTYNYENGNLKRATIYFGQDTDYEPFLMFEFTYNTAGNLTQTVSMVSNGMPGMLVRAGHVDAQYDNKTNPLYAQRELMILFWQSISKNNVTLEDHFDANQVAEDRFTYNYTYNAKGLPTAAVVAQGLPGGPTTALNVLYVY